MEFWGRLKERPLRHIVSLYRVLKRLDLIPEAKKCGYVPKTYTQMTLIGKKVQVGVKYVPFFLLAHPSVIKPLDHYSER